MKKAASAAKRAEKPAAPEQPSSSERKHQAIVEAAKELFLKGGYLGTNMDEIAAVSEVSKQTVYKHFASKEALFVEIVNSMTNTAGDTVHNEIPDLEEGGDVASYLVDYATRQLTVVLTPPIMQLRRLVIGEVGRFSELGKVLYERGPQRAINMLAALFERLVERGVLAIDDVNVAASHFNWLVMSEPLNRIMLLGDEAIPKTAELRRHAKEAVRVFLAAYGHEPARRYPLPRRRRG
jgi:AcrR family transcriptional regulator